MRRRLASMIGDFSDLDQEVARYVEQQLGIPGPWSSAQSWYTFLGDAQLQDVLDFVTLAYSYLMQKQRTGFREMNAPARWLGTVQQSFSDENVHYRVDEQGRVHFHFDKEFAQNRAATIASLKSSRYTNVLDAFEAGMAALSKGPPDGKGAVRSVFSAVEGVFRLISRQAPRLAADQVDRLVPLIQQIYSQDETALRSASKMLASLKDWIDAAHFYRHEQGTQDVVSQPPLSLAVYLVSIGASHLRWLAELDVLISNNHPSKL
jgi:hypothetical protein